MYIPVYLSRRRRTERSSGERTRLPSPKRGESDSSKLKVLRFVIADDLNPKHKKTMKKMRLYDNLDIVVLSEMRFNVLVRENCSFPSKLVVFIYDSQ